MLRLSSLLLAGELVDTWYRLLWVYSFGTFFCLFWFSRASQTPKMYCFGTCFCLFWFSKASQTSKMYSFGTCFYLFWFSQASQRSKTYSFGYLSEKRQISKASKPSASKAGDFAEISDFVNKLPVGLL